MNSQFKQIQRESGKSSLCIAVMVGSIVGPIGLMCMLAARAAGATTIVITDLAPNRLEAGKRLGADVIFRVGPDGDGDLVEAIRSGAVPRPDVTIEASGAQTGISNAIQVCIRSLTRYERTNERTNEF